jgi:hypothetical protein
MYEKAIIPYLLFCDQKHCGNKALNLIKNHVLPCPSGVIAYAIYQCEFMMS